MPDRTNAKPAPLEDAALDDAHGGLLLPAVLAAREAARRAAPAAGASATLSGGT